MTRKIIYIINPVAGTATKKNLQQFIEEKTLQQKIPFKIFPSVASGDYTFLHSIIREEKITDVVIAGGDGTVSQVVESLMNFDLNFGIIPCGSGNGLAFAAKIPKLPAKALDIIFIGSATPIDGYMVNDRFACMLSGLGFDARVAHDFANEPKRGLAVYVKLAFKNFFAMKSFPVEVQLEETNFKTKAYFISIANSNQFGNNFTIAPKASLSDGLLDIVIVTGQNKVSFILQTIKQLAGWNKLQPSSLIQQQKAVIYFQAEKLTIGNPSNAPLHIDGEPAETQDKINIAIKKKCLRLIQPV
ncbi:MAG: YegS/Rv2252/BmrU family lipid kinase [Chitinophagaceae bacterium]|nr:MAG: YegS/Rv2252/BmrU family lipid kinase [Chitinophagaceae bacterium]